MQVVGAIVDIVSCYTQFLGAALNRTACSEPRKEIVGADTKSFDSAECMAGIGYQTEVPHDNLGTDSTW